MTTSSEGISSISWSPDQELVVVINSSGVGTILDCDFNPVSEFKATGQDSGENAFINVGWGSKETQFHGTEGKEAAKAKNIEVMLHSSLTISQLKYWLFNDKLLISN